MNIWIDGDEFAAMAISQNTLLKIWWAGTLMFTEQSLEFKWYSWTVETVSEKMPTPGLHMWDVRSYIQPMKYYYNSLGILGLHIIFFFVLFQL